MYTFACYLTQSSYRQNERNYLPLSLGLRKKNDPLEMEKNDFEFKISGRKKDDFYVFALSEMRKTISV